jgi:hypothetical protein
MTSIRLLLGFGSEVVFQTVAYVKKSPLSLAELIGSDHRVLCSMCFRDMSIKVVIYVFINGKLSNKKD